MVLQMVNANLNLSFIIVILMLIMYKLMNNNVNLMIYWIPTKLLIDFIIFY